MSGSTGCFSLLISFLVCLSHFSCIKVVLFPFCMKSNKYTYVPPVWWTFHLTFLTCNGRHWFAGIIVDDFLNFMNKFQYSDEIKSSIIGFSLCCHITVESRIFQLLSCLFQHPSADVEEVCNLHAYSSGVSFKEDLVPFLQTDGVQAFLKLIILHKNKSKMIFAFKKQKSDKESKKKYI